ncbi:uncharacterized protein LOC144383623 isoform X2 [Gasterosteus aculeatus]
MMPSISVTQLFLLSALLHITTSLPVREEEEVEAFLTQVGQLNAWSPSRMNSANALLEAGLRRLLSAGLDRRRQLGDIEFSNSGAGGDSEKVNLLLKQYMCPSVYDSWPTDL